MAQNILSFNKGAWQPKGNLYPFCLNAILGSNSIAKVNASCQFGILKSLLSFGASIAQKTSSLK